MEMNRNLQRVGWGPVSKSLEVDGKVFLMRALWASVFNSPKPLIRLASYLNVVLEY